MKNLVIVVPKGQDNNLSSIVGTYKIFMRANKFWKQQGGDEPFLIRLASVSEEVTFCDGLFTVKPHIHISAIAKADLVIIPSLNHNYEEAVRENQQLVDWISMQYDKGAEVASICTGVFLLAAKGMLNGMNCSTHWSAANTLRTMFPDVNVQPDKIITDEKGIYTNGGAFSFLNLVIYLVEKFYDRTTAIYCAKVFQIEMDRNSQSEFTIFTGQKLHGDEVVKQAQAFIESKLHEKISMKELAAKFAVGRRNFDRRFIKATGNTPVEYCQRVKVEAAKKALESSSKTVNEVMYEVGYVDVKAFREVFRKITGISPIQYRTKYNKEVQVV